MYTVVGQSKEQTLNLNPVPHRNADSERLMQMLASNSSGSATYCIVYAIQDGETLARIDVPATDSRNVQFGSHGKSASGGFVVERSATGLIVTATSK